ncbi:hypothetical protein [Helicobacter bilis]|uniref:hypothetical protein n=1 Tax=Helicobacter bilis TaxID=37372 RepID=UPI001315276A|nr:hypothetical protein [Helicobacter bilis]
MRQLEFKAMPLRLRFLQRNRIKQTLSCGSIARQFSMLLRFLRGSVLYIHDRAKIDNSLKSVRKTTHALFIPFR